MFFFNHETFGGENNIKFHSTRKCCSIIKRLKWKKLSFNLSMTIISKNFICSISYSRELSYTTTSFGGSFRSDKESIGVETVSVKHVSARRMYSMIGPDWIYGVVGTICAFIAGAQMPLFALGVSQALVAFYMDWDTTRHEVKKIAFLFCGAAVITVIVHAIEHLCFGIMGERLTLRVREKMFSGEF